MSEPRMQVSVTGDGRSAELRFLPASGLEGAVTLDFDQLTLLMNALAVVRSRLGQVVPQPLLEHSRFQAIVNPRWLTQPEAATEGSLIAFHHPGYGPVGFVLPAAEVRRLVEALGTHLAMVHSSERPPGSQPS